MALMSLAPRLERVAETITERVADLLCAQVAVVDDRGIVIAGNGVPIIGSLYDESELGAMSPALRVPLQLGAQRGEVIVSEPLNGEAFSARLAQALVELVITQTTSPDRPPNQHERKHTFIHDLLRGDTIDEETVLREAKILGMNLATPRAVILIDAADYILTSSEATRFEPTDAEVRRRAQHVIGSIVNFFHLPDDTICAYLGDGEVAVLKASNTQNLVPWADRGDNADQSCDSWANLNALKRAGTALLIQLRMDTRAELSMGIGRYHPGLRGLARSYGDARAALLLGRRFQGRNGVHCLNALGIAAFVGVSDEQTKIDLATNLLSPLDHERELLETLAAFFTKDCCPSTSATQLSIHRNTLSYRLNKITSLIGLDPRRFDDAVQIRLALLLRPLQHVEH